MRRRAALALLAVHLPSAFAAACGGDDTANPVSFDGGHDATSQPETGDALPGETGGDAGGDAGNVDRGPSTLPFAGDPNGLFWDYGSGAALYIADSANNKIVRWADKGGFSDAALLPAPPDGGDPALGQVLRLLDGTMLVTRFGFGQFGAVVAVSKSGDAGVVGAAVPDGGFAPLSTRRLRIGVAMLADGTLVDTYFTGGDDAGRIGAIAKLNLLTGKESDLVTGLSKPVAVLYNEGKIYVTDQDLAYLIAAPLTGGAFVDPDAAAPDAGDEGGMDAAPVDAGPQPRVFATIPLPDLLCQGPDGAIFSGSSGGTVYQIDRKGTVTSLATGLKSARGCAYDGANKRLFVAEHDPAGTAHTIRIIPVP
jgi:hypothetical protein